MPWTTAEKLLLRPGGRGWVSDPARAGWSALRLRPLRDGEAPFGPEGR
jgi:hypothetical protein